MVDSETEAAYAIATANRLLAADMFASLTPEQWRTPSLCAGWTVREVAGHLVEPLESQIGVLGLVAALIRYRGSLDRMVDATARTSAARPTTAIVESLRTHASVRLDPPVIGARGPMTDTFIHLRDAARPLGLDVNPAPEAWRHVLDFLARPTRATKALVPSDRVAGLRLVATDLDWQYGEGAEVRGPSEAIGMAIAGRPVALQDLDGPGVDTFRTRF